MPVTMSVELAQGELGEAFEADALNVSAGGLGIRSAMLPDIGQRMTCRFSMDELEDPCEAEGEVVWASDAGADAGEFGIRFDTLEPRVGEALARWVASLEDLPAPAPGKKASRSVRVQLDGVASPIDAEVAFQSGDVVRVEQALPFLALGTGAVLAGHASASGRRVLRSVELRVEGDVPRLVLELAARPSSAAERTMNDEPLDELLAPRPEARRASPLRGDDAHDAYASRDAIDPSDEQDEPAPRAESAADAQAPRPVAPPASDVAIERPSARPRARRDDDARAVRLEASDREVSIDALIASATAPTDPDQETSLLERARVLGAMAGPALARTTSALRSGWAAFVATTGPRARALYAALARGLRALADAIRERAPGALQRLLGRTPKRRTTAPPPPSREPTASRRTQKAADVAPTPRTVSPRAVVAGVLAMAAIAIVVRAMASDDASTDEVPVHLTSTVVEEVSSPPSAAAPSVAEAPVVATPPAASTSPASTAPATTASPGEATALAAEPAALALPGTMPEPTTEAGRIPAPTFPGVGDAPSAEAVVEPRTIDDDGDLAFGAAEVPHGRTTTLRMSLPVTAIEGESDSTGFTVTFHGALSLDRAGPIAAANPSVERAAILNRGDHAVLTVRFVAGRTPTYRVEATGSSATVTIGR